MAVEVICTIASWRLRIVGSGTSCTRTTLGPCQVFARIALCLLRHALGRWLRRPLPGSAPVEHRLGHYDVAGLHDLLEPDEVLADLLVGSLVLHLCNGD